MKQSSPAQPALAQDLTTLVDEAADLLQDAGGTTLRRAQEALAAAGATIRSRGDDAAGATREYVTAHPWRAVGIAAFAGALAGVLLARR